MYHSTYVYTRDQIQLPAEPSWWVLRGILSKDMDGQAKDSAYFSIGWLPLQGSNLPQILVL